MMLPISEPAACRAFFGDAIRTVTPLPTSGFSGSDVLLVEQPAPPAAGRLVRWVMKSFGRGTHIRHAAWVHRFMSHLRFHGIEVVSAVKRVVPDGRLQGGSVVTATLVEDASGLLWEAVEFLPGKPVAMPDPPARAEAMRCLAAIHVAAAMFPDAPPRRMQSRGLVERMERAASLRERSWLKRWQGEAGRGARSRCGEPIARLFERAIDAFAMEGPASLERIERTPLFELSCQAVLRDVWSDHVLIEGGRVRGIIDFQAAGIDTVATDLARLVGSWMLASSNAAAWDECLAAYETVRPLHDDERRLVAFLHHAGVIVAIDNWFRWLVEEGRSFPDADAVATRLGQLVDAAPGSIAALRP